MKKKTDKTPLTLKRANIYRPGSGPGPDSSLDLYTEGGRRVSRAKFDSKDKDDTKKAAKETTNEAIRLGRKVKAGAIIIDPEAFDDDDEDDIEALVTGKR